MRWSVRAGGFRADGITVGTLGTVGIDVVVTDVPTRRPCRGIAPDYAARSKEHVVHIGGFSGAVSCDQAPAVSSRSEAGVIVSLPKRNAVEKRERVIVVLGVDELGKLEAKKVEVERERLYRTLREVEGDVELCAVADARVIGLALCHVEIVALCRAQRITGRQDEERTALAREVRGPVRTRHREKSRIGHRNPKVGDKRPTAQG
jgi:hypothetical protein